MEVMRCDLDSVVRFIRVWSYLDLGHPRIADDFVEIPKSDVVADGGCINPHDTEMSKKSKNWRRRRRRRRDSGHGLNLVIIMCDHSVALYLSLLPSLPAAG